MIATGAFLFVVCLALPFLAWKSYRYSTANSGGEDTTPNSTAVAIQSLVIHSVVLGLAVAAAGSTQLRVVWFSRPSATALLVGLAIVAVFTLIAVLEARRPLQDRDRLRAQLRSTGLSGPWLATMLVAAVAEEYAYRGVLFSILAAHLPPTVAAAIAAVAFGLGHLSQGVRGAVLGVAFAASMQFLLAASGALILPMACHLVYDLAVSCYGRFLTPEGRKGQPSDDP